MATRTYDLCRRWAMAGHPSTVFVSNINHYDFRRMRRIRGLRLWVEEDLEGVTMVWIRTIPYSGNDWRRAANQLSFAVLAVLAGLLRRPGPDVVVGVSVHPLAALAGWLLARARGARFFFEVTDLWPQSLIDLGALREGSAVARGMRALEAFLYRRAERIIMLWRHTGDYVASLGVSPAKIVWAPHGVELDRYAGLAPYDGAPRRPFRVVYMGGFVASMALDNLLAAARLLQERGRDDIVFRLFGSGTHKDEVVELARAWDLRNVEFPPPVPKREIARAMNEADAFVWGVRDAPLYRYGMSLNKLADYLAGARPLLYYGRSSYDPVTEAKCGFTVPPEDPAALAAAVERMADLDVAERLEMGRRGREWLLEHHHIPALAERLLAVFESAPGGAAAVKQPAP